MAVLKDYQRKRDFKSTPEPPPSAPNSGNGPLSFVVQKHRARQLHYDFRLEVDGVLKSWAVTKGPSRDPEVKRLAVMVEDHPLDYASFEGNIPSGQYGAGEVLVWDNGTYSPDEGGELSFDDRAQAEKRVREGLAAGKLSITLRGTKLKGSWTLVKMKNGTNNWLLIKHRDEFAGVSPDILTEDTSVVSGRTIDELKSDPPGRQITSDMVAKISGTLKTAFPASVSPMLATLSAIPRKPGKWWFEPKLDGFRTLAFKNADRVWLQSRRGIKVTDMYPDQIEGIKHQAADQVILDGEMVAFDSDGRICFQCLQNRGANTARTRQMATVYYVFDILYLDGYNVTGAVLEDRRKLLNDVFRKGHNIQLVEQFSADGNTVFQAAIENGLEGIIAKRPDSRYEPGKRSDNWLKIKAVSSEDFVIGGFTPGQGARENTFGALLLGYFDKENRLRYIGNVGSGFDEKSLSAIRKRLDGLLSAANPVSDVFEPPAGVNWVKPELVAEIKFAEVTREHRLRAPVFLRMRDDKPKESANGAGIRGLKTDPTG